MTKERIAYVMPINTDDPDNATPLLVYDVDELPIVEDLHFSVFMLGLTEGEPYWLDAQILFNDMPIHKPTGVWVRAKLKFGNPDDVAASINMHFEKCIFERQGNYLIKVSLRKDGEVLHENGAYFRISKHE
ncbi:hypothetical protein ABFP18_002618 [Enterobacter hormaechei]|uniref:hypothetical protein n=1 Tax=Enterobacter TaxID=547 RepID=UPI0007913DB6|nr:MULTISPECIES: hypothetical protein [Enterobacter]EHN8825923.1 hypothetical protein [Enterobacter bugandensis]EHN8844161.1 hypothetical protein [Enterobacter bugandensis]MBW7763987.1 hypothetical protein [Enterobacter hormaechei]MCK6732591.1 hypothetical protein [Enterobacter bugandensis]MCM7374219.1 hypothetical protein [Enterobacter bugandensis]